MTGKLEKICINHPSNIEGEMTGEDREVGYDSLGCYDCPATIAMATMCEGYRTREDLDREDIKTERCR